MEAPEVTVGRGVLAGGELRMAHCESENEGVRDGWICRTVDVGVGCAWMCLDENPR